MKHKILLVEQHLHRGFEANLVIGSYLKRMGHEVEYALTGSHLTSRLLTFRPDLVYYPWVSPYVHGFLRRRTSEVPIINSFQEQYLVIDNPASDFARQVLLSDHLFLWGEAFAEKARALNPDVGITITGNPRFDVYFSTQLQKAIVPSRQELAHRFHIPADKKWVLLAMDYPILFLKPARVQKMKQMKAIDEEYLAATRQAYDRLAEWLKRFVPRHPELVFIIRPHPGSNLEQIRKDQGIEQHANVFYLMEGAINQWIIHCDLVITRFSTSIIEAWMAKKPASLYMTDLLPPRFARYMHVQEATGSLNTYDAFEAFLLGQMPTHDEGHDAFIKRHFFASDGRSSYRAAVALDELARALPARSDYKPLFWEDYLERAKAGVKKVLVESGLNQYNPFSRPSLSYISSAEVKAMLDKIERVVQDS